MCLGIWGHAIEILLELELPRQVWITLQIDTTETEPPICLESVMYT